VCGVECRDALLVSRIGATPAARPYIAKYSILSRGVVSRLGGFTLSNDHRIVDVIQRDKKCDGTAALGAYAETRLAELERRYGLVKLVGRGGGCTRSSEPSITFFGSGTRTDDDSGELRTFLGMLWNEIQQ